MASKIASGLFASQEKEKSVTAEGEVSAAEAVEQDDEQDEDKNSALSEKSHGGDIPSPVVSSPTLSPSSFTLASSASHSQSSNLTPTTAPSLAASSMLLLQQYLPLLLAIVAILVALIVVRNQTINSSSEGETID